METAPYEILSCHTSRGRVPLEEWLDSLDAQTAARVMVRIDRLLDGNFGDHKAINSGLIELRIQFGAGCRVYLAVRGRQIHLLGGDSKATQAKDIKAARKFWETHDD